MRLVLHFQGTNWCKRGLEHVFFKLSIFLQFWWQIFYVLGCQGAVIALLVASQLIHGRFVLLAKEQLGGLVRLLSDGFKYKYSSLPAFRRSFDVACSMEHGTKHGVFFNICGAITGFTLT